MAEDPVCGMNVKEAEALRISHAGETYYFCSRCCADIFEKEKGLSSRSETTSCGETSIAVARKKWYQNRTVFTLFTAAIFLCLSYFLPLLRPFREAFFMYLSSIWWAMALGLLFGGVIDYFVPREYVSKFLSGESKRSIFHAVLGGFLMSTCSHGILALAIQLYKKGASTAAVVSFLLASPWANFPLTIILIGFFGWKAFFLIGSAVVIALLTGFIFQVLERNGWVEANPYYLGVGEGFSIRRDLRTRFASFHLNAPGILKTAKGVWNGTIALADMVLWWILVGMILASLAAAYVPSSFFMNYMGPSFLGLVVTLAFATVLEVCSEGTAPLAFEVFRQTGAFGNVLVFLLAGVATDYTEIGLLWSNVGKKTALWLPLVAIPQILVLGLLANKLL